jgi:hypothetical protein
MYMSVYNYVWVFMYVCKKFAIVRMHTCIALRHSALSAYIYLYGHMCESVCVCVFVCTRVRVCVCVCERARGLFYLLPSIMH